VPFWRSNFSYSFSHLDAFPSHDVGLSEKETREQSAIYPILIYNGASGRGGISVPFALRQIYTTLPHGTLRRALARLLVVLSFVLSMASIAFIFFRLQLLASPWLRGKSSKELSWGQWVEFMTPRGRISRMVGLDKRWRTFMQDVCIPLFSAVCTAPRNDVENHPAEELLGALFRSTFSKSFRHLNLMWRTLILRFHMAHIYDTPLCRFAWCS
jgi:hypothetical protein